MPHYQKAKEQFLQTKKKYYEQLQNHPDPVHEKQIHSAYYREKNLYFDLFREPSMKSMLIRNLGFLQLFPN